MAFDINAFRSQLTFGGARNAYFQVQITNPVNSTADLKTPFMVTAATLPSSNLGLIEVPYMGRRIKQAGDRTFESWQVTVNNDEDFLIRNAMENWMAAINSHQGNITTLGTSAPLAYKTNAQITQFARNGAILRVYNFDGLFPTLVSDIQTDWADTDRIEQFQITFQYDWWNIVGGLTGDAGTNV